MEDRRSRPPPLAQKESAGNMDLNPPAVPKVLVVEDEMMLRMRAVEIVEDAGFIPVEAVNADEAFAILESRSDIELLFTDIQMPGSMDGLKLAHAVHERWPAIKIILVSGKPMPTDAEKPASSRFFGKPLEMERMIGEMQDMIGRGSLRIVQADIPPMPAKPAQNGTRRISEKSRAEDSTDNEFLTAENDSLRLLLEQAGIDAKALLAQAGIDAREREAADKLQKLILPANGNEYRAWATRDPGTAGRAWPGARPAFAGEVAERRPGEHDPRGDGAL
jgi:CheY-like chemotaxis protein